MQHHQQEEEEEEEEEGQQGEGAPGSLFPPERAATPGEEQDGWRDGWMSLPLALYL